MHDIFNIIFIHYLLSQSERRTNPFRLCCGYQSLTIKLYQMVIINYETFMSSFVCLFASWMPLLYSSVSWNSTYKAAKMSSLCYTLINYKYSQNNSLVTPDTYIYLSGSMTTWYEDNNKKLPTIPRRSAIFTKNCVRRCMLQIESHKFSSGHKIS